MSVTIQTTLNIEELEDAGIDLKNVSFKDNVDKIKEWVSHKLNIEANKVSVKLVKMK